MSGHKLPFQAVYDYLGLPLRGMQYQGNGENYTMRCIFVFLFLFSLE